MDNQKLKQLLENLLWFQENSSIQPNKRYIIDRLESQSVQVVIEAVQDII